MPNTSITTIPLLQHPHTSSLQLHPHTHHSVTPGFVDKPRWSDGAAGQWRDKRDHRTPPKTRVKGVGRQQQEEREKLSVNCYENIRDVFSDVIGCS